MSIVRFYKTCVEQILILCVDVYIWNYGETALPSNSSEGEHIWRFCSKTLFYLIFISFNIGVYSYVQNTDYLGIYITFNLFKEIKSFFCKHVCIPFYFHSVGRKALRSSK